MERCLDLPALQVPQPSALALPVAAVDAAATVATGSALWPRLGLPAMRGHDWGGNERRMITKQVF